MAAALQSAGIASADALREIGPDAAYQALISAGSRPHFIAYYSLVMGLQGRAWNDCAGPEKDALRQRFDALVSAAQPKMTALEMALDELGVRFDDTLPRKD